MTIKLYDLCGRDRDRRFSPYCWRVKKALQHKGLAYETIAVAFSEIAQLEGNSQNTVPMVCDGDITITDSFLIAEYLDDRYPDRPSLFGCKGAIAVCRFIEAWTASALHPGIIRMVAKDIHDILDEKDKTYFRTTREERLKATLEEMHAMRDESRIGFHSNLLVLDQMLRQQAFIGGNAPNYADYIVYGSLKWPAQCSDYNFMPQKPRILDWYAGLDR